MPRTRTLAHVAALLAPLALASCAGSIGVEEEAQLGAQYAAEIRGQVRLIQDPVAVEALNRMGQGLASRADSTGRRYTFYLVDSPEVNAFAIPGGHVFVNRGLIEHADLVSEMAGVLGHEIAHVTERHGLEQLEKQQRANILVRLVYWVLDREPGMVEQVVIQGGGAAVFAKYGRDAEREADERAVVTLANAGYDPDGIATFFEELLREQREQPTSFDQWFASHPTSTERVRNTRAIIGTLGPLDRDRMIRDTPEYQRFRARVQALPSRAPAARRGG
ncbi:MAG TPA: M48 family metallopeptidase [Longimicrobium sp.]|jgi:predicted Zn-dependent protease